MTLLTQLRYIARRGAFPFLGSLVLVACQERLAAPADCPTLCPGGYVVRDTILDAATDQDSSYEGYVTAGSGGYLRVSQNLPASEDRGVVRFVPRPVLHTTTTDTLPYTVDSVSLSLTVAYRDTTVKDLYVFLYRLPATTDSNITFSEVEAAFTPANLIDSLHVDDTLQAQRLTAILRDSAALARVAIPDADSGVLAMGIQIRAAAGTGVRISALGTDAPNFFTWATVANSDTTTLAITYNRGPRIERFVSQTTPALDASVLTVGGVPSARSLIRFDWPEYLRDSVQLLRATLELVPTTAIPGLYGDSAFIQARPVLADLGSKSPIASDAFYLAVGPVVLGQTDTVRLEVRRATTLWQGTKPRPSAFILNLFPEAGSFTRATFGSSRTPGFVPRLRVTYALKFPFEAP